LILSQNGASFECLCITKKHRSHLSFTRKVPIIGLAIRHSLNLLQNCSIGNMSNDNTVYIMPFCLPSGQRDYKAQRINGQVLEMPGNL
jgi:hypothetical protein